MELTSQPKGHLVTLLAGQIAWPTGSPKWPIPARNAKVIREVVRLMGKGQSVGFWKLDPHHWTYWLGHMGLEVHS